MRWGWGQRWEEMNSRPPSTKGDGNSTTSQRTSWAFLVGIKNSIFRSRRHKQKHLTRKNSSNI